MPHGRCPSCKKVVRYQLTEAELKTWFEKYQANPAPVTCKSCDESLRAQVQTEKNKEHGLE